MASSSRGGLPGAVFADACSPSWSVRAGAGRRLAMVAEDADAAVVLRRLLLDGGDTAVSRATAEALLERGDVCGLRLVLAALADADDTTGDWICTAVNDVCCRSEEDLARLGALLSVLASDADASISEEADSVLRDLGLHR